MVIANPFANQYVEPRTVHVPKEGHVYSMKHWAMACFGITEERADELQAGLLILKTSWCVKGLQ